MVLIYAKFVHLNDDDEQESDYKFIQEYLFDKLDDYGHGDAFIVYRSVKGNYNKANVRSFFRIPMFNFLFRHFVNGDEFEKYFDSQKIKKNIGQDMSIEEK